MRLAPLLVPALAIALFAQALAPSRAVAEQEAFTPAQEEAVRDLVRDYLLKYPELLVEALEIYRDRQELLAEQRKREAVVAHRAALELDPETPVLGNPEGDVVIVEFFDYRCGYCKRTADMVRDVVHEDGNVRLVMKEFPILGPNSVFAAQVALAAEAQGKYEELHFALMAERGNLDQSAVFAVADSLGLDVERLKQDMRSEHIARSIRRNHELAEALQITGTPAFVIAGRLVPGAIDRQQLLALIAQGRAG